jgi:hypothetical protein
MNLRVRREPEQTPPPKLDNGIRELMSEEALSLSTAPFALLAMWKGVPTT